MRLWRLAKSRHEHASLADEAEGARIVGGRWNSKRVPLVYAAFNIATAAMEVLVHVDWAMAPELVLLAIDIPDGIAAEIVDAKELPDDWPVFPAPPELAGIGDEWVRSGRSLLLDVPSAACPYERIALINPLHADAGRCSVRAVGPYSIDGRLRR